MERNGSSAWEKIKYPPFVELKCPVKLLLCEIKYPTYLYIIHDSNNKIC